jgi:hypothetical protein
MRMLTVILGSCLFSGVAFAGADACQVCVQSQRVDTRSVCAKVCLGEDESTANSNGRILCQGTDQFNHYLVIWVNTQTNAVSINAHAPQIYSPSSADGNLIYKSSISGSVGQCTTYDQLTIPAYILTSEESRPGTFESVVSGTQCGGEGSQVSVVCRAAN